MCLCVCLVFFILCVLSMFCVFYVFMTNFCFCLCVCISYCECSACRVFVVRVFCFYVLFVGVNLFDLYVCDCL